LDTVRVGRHTARPMATPTEFEWHREIAAELERRVRNRDFFVWLNVTGRRRGEPTDYDTLAREIETGLRGLDAETHSPMEPGFHAHGPKLDLEVRAIPKKPDARGSQPLVANPVPAVPYWEYADRFEIKSFRRAKPGRRP
jgi:hypothetical protein